MANATSSTAPTGLTILFPDGGIVSTSGARGVLNAAVPAIDYFDSSGTTIGYNYTAFSLEEAVFFYSQIKDGIVAGLSAIQLLSFAPLPTMGNVAATDMYPNGSIVTPTPASVVGNQFMLLTIGSSGAGWPIGSGSALVRSFKPDGKVTIGGQEATNYVYMDGVTISFSTPALVAGTYDLVYTDGRGSVTKAASVIYS